jgi:ribosomal-protein-alanine N-acetyltransferase
VNEGSRRVGDAGGPESRPERRVRTDGSGSGVAGPHDVVVRRATRADLLDVYRIEKQCFTQPWPYAAFETFLDQPGFLVAVDGREAVADTLVGDGSPVVGYVVSDVMPNHGRGIGHVKDIAVRPDARGAGLGRHLLHRALVALSVGGASLVKLEVRVSNDAALSLYRDVGFEPVRRVRGYYADGEDAFVMVLDVDAWRGRG